MQHLIRGPLPDNARNFLRRAGYGEHTGREGQTSFTKRLGGGTYPRFHAYVEDKNGGVQINLHVDQKQASYEGSRAHGGEYEGSLVEREMARLIAFAEQLKSSPPPPPAEEPKPKRSWFSAFWK